MIPFYFTKNTQTQFIHDEQGLRPWVMLLQHHLQGQPLQTEVPLDIQGSAFQWNVWKALQAIPVGSTRSCREKAQAIGAQASAQEIAQACATNPVAVFIPCHRVIRSNGEVGGYYWSRVRKQRLLALERAAARKAPTDEAELVPSRYMVSLSEKAGNSSPKTPIEREER